MTNYTKYSKHDAAPLDNRSTPSYGDGESFMSKFERMEEIQQVTGRRQLIGWRRSQVETDRK